jgi:ribonuclease HII
LSPAAQYALTDGFPVRGLPVPNTAVWKGDATVACIAAASVLAKVTRDRIMTELHEQWPVYDFAGHKGYVTPTHNAALREHGPCEQHRRRYINVRRAMQGETVLEDNGPVDAVGVVDLELESAAS